MNMNEAIIGQPYRIRSFSSSADSDFVSRLMQYGFIEGEKLTVVRRAPLFKDPLLVEIRGSQIVISKSEASFINVEGI
jgi:Fe2+ transport system protein FeoA